MQTALDLIDTQVSMDPRRVKSPSSQPVGYPVSMDYSALGKRLRAVREQLREATRAAEIDALLADANGGASQFGPRLKRAGLPRPSSHQRPSVAGKL